VHIKKVTLHPDKYPTREHYPFNLSLFRETEQILLDSAVTIFVGENGTGKSTLLEAIARNCNIHIWRNNERTRPEHNRYEGMLHQHISVEWVNGRVPGSFFGSQIFQHFAELLDTWAAADRGQFDYFGGKSLTTQSHGQSLMSFFRSRYQIKGLYLLDEPETALSPRSQIELLDIIKNMSSAGHAQFIIATHSPLLLACPAATIYSFDMSPVKKIQYVETDHFLLYKSFLENPEQYLKRGSEN
jgi:predicted ATPase